MKKKKVSIGGIIEEIGSTERNKTGDWRALRPIIDEKKCTKCGICWMYCPDNAIDKNLKIDYDYCKGCGICSNLCPVKAIKMVKEEK